MSGGGSGGPTAAPTGPIIGIDLGTTFSAIAFLNGFGRAEVIPNRQGERTTPSVILFPPGAPPLVGQEAKERSAEHPERVVEFFKREMGDPDWRFNVDGESLTPPAVSAIILRELVAQAEAVLGTRPTSAVITCPAYFGDLERQATADAGALAGLEVLAVFNEPTAAALAYGLHHAAKGGRIRAMVYDLGGGTFDVTVLELHGRRVRVLATAGEHKLGGKDWDDELVNWASEEFLAQHGVDPREDLGAVQDLRNRCEAAKVLLSKKPKAALVVAAHGKTARMEITRQLFDELTRPLLEQTKTYVDQVLAASKLRWDELDVILPVGGSSYMPQVRELLTRCAGRAPEVVIDPDLAIAQGAAYYAALLRSQQGFEIKVLAEVGSDPTRQGSLEEAPELLGSLKGEVVAAPAEAGMMLRGKVAAPAAKPPGAPVAIFAVPTLPGQEVGPQVAVVGALRGRTAAPEETGALRGRTAGAPEEAGALRGRKAGSPAEVGALRGRKAGPAAPPPPLQELPYALRGRVASTPGAAPAGQRPQEMGPGALRGRTAPEELPGALRGRTQVPAAPPGRLAPLPETAPTGLTPAAPLPGQLGAPPSTPAFDLAAALAAAGGDVPELGRTMVFDFSDLMALSVEPGAAGGLPPAGSNEFAGLQELSDQLPPPVVNVNARALGVLVFSQGRARTSVMIASNSPLPAMKRGKFVTINDNQTAVKVVVLEGDNPDPEQCRRVGECVISGLPARPRGQEVEVAYSYDQDGRIRIWARDVTTGRAAQATLTREGQIDATEQQRLTELLSGLCG